MRATSTSKVRLGAIVFASAWLAALGLAAKQRPWEELQGCTLIANDYNDGDSFHVLYNNTEHIFRLYYVDCAETLKNLNQRMAEQAAYWNVPEEEIYDLGKQATEFTAKFLKYPFKVKTCWQHALGRSRLPRQYAFISAFGQDLGEALVQNGLAQVYGEKRKAPQGFSVRQYIARLLRLEAEARKFRRGAWSRLPPNSPLNADRGVRQTSEGAAYVLPWDTTVYSTNTHPERVGTLRETSVVWLLEERPDGFILLRFDADDGSSREFLARRNRLGLPPGPVIITPSSSDDD